MVNPMVKSTRSLLLQISQALLQTPQAAHSTCNSILRESDALFLTLKP